ncbi:MAG: two-component system phosphate regulon response regulator PhoB [Myxococcota bacterium]|jgi:two-component system phosphate regulon response regulator PhoB
MEGMQPLILIVEDEHDFAAALSYSLQSEGYSVRLAPTGAAALEATSQSPQPDLILLDLGLPDMPGTEVCRQLRSSAETRELPIIMVTARGDEIDRVVGFEIGADDYVVKPFSLRELLLRVRVLLRRSAKIALPGKHLQFNNIRLDQGAHQAWLGNKELPLTVLEFRLLSILIAHKGQVKSREILFAEVWNRAPEGAHRTVDKHIQRLRKKLGPAGNYIKTIRGVGYRIGEPSRFG